MTDQLQWQEPEARPRSRRGGVYLVIGAIVIFVLGILIAIQGIRTAMQPLDTLTEPFPDESVRPPDRYPDLIQPPLNILVVGSTSHEETGGRLEDHLDTRAEAVFIVHLASGHFASQIVLLPEQLSAQLQSTLSQNSTTVAPLVHEVEVLLQDRVNHVMLLDLTAAVDATGAVGGIPLAEDGYAGPKQVAELLDTDTETAGGTLDPDTLQQIITGLLTRLNDPHVLADQEGIITVLRNSLEDNAAVDEGLHSGQLINIGRSAGAFSPEAVTWCRLPDPADPDPAQQAEIDRMRELFQADQLAQC